MLLELVIYIAIVSLCISSSLLTIFNISQESMSLQHQAVSFQETLQIIDYIQVFIHECKHVEIKNQRLECSSSYQTEALFLKNLTIMHAINTRVVPLHSSEAIFTTFNPSIDQGMLTILITINNYTYTLTYDNN